MIIHEKVKKEEEGKGEATKSVFVGGKVIWAKPPSPARGARQLLPTPPPFPLHDFFFFHHRLPQAIASQQATEGNFHRIHYHLYVLNVSPVAFALPTVVGGPCRARVSNIFHHSISSFFFLMMPSPPFVRSHRPPCACRGGGQTFSDRMLCGWSWWERGRTLVAKQRPHSARRHE